MDIQQNNVAVLHFNLVNQDGSTIFIRKTKLATFNLINPSAVSVPITDIGFDATLNQCWIRISKESNAATGQYYGVLNIVDDDWGTYTTSKIKVYSVVSDADEDTKSVVFTATCIATQVTNPSGGNSPYYNATTGTWWQYSDTLKAFEDTGVGNLIKYITKNVQHLKDGTGNGSVVTCLDDEISANNIATGLCSTDLGKNNDNRGESCVALGENNYIAEGVSNATAIAGAQPSAVDVFAVGDKTAGHKNVFEINKFGDISFRPDSSQERIVILQDILDSVIKNVFYDSSKYSLTVTFYSAADNANKTKTYDLSGLKAVLKDDAVKEISVNQETAVMTVNTINGSSQQIQLPTTYLPLAGGTLTGDLLFSNSGTATRGMYGTVCSNDSWRLVGGASGEDLGWVELATADDGKEPIYVRQYVWGNNNSYHTITHSATLLDASGNTLFPGIVTASAFSGNASSATKLATARTIGLSGVTATTQSFDGTANITIPITAVPATLLTGTASISTTGNAATATTATTLDGYYTTLHYDNSTAGGFYGNVCIPVINTDGGLEVGKFIDFHNSSTLQDFTTRIMCTSAPGHTVTLPTYSGTLALTTDNVASATKLANARTITLTGDTTGSGSFDGSANLSIATTTSYATAAGKLNTARNIGLSGVTATTQSFDGSANITIPITAVPATLLTGTASISTTGNAATATKATQDGSGNEITSTYLPLLGGSLHGPLRWNEDSLPTATSLSYILGVDSFGEGGTTRWCDANSVTVGKSYSSNFIKSNTWNWSGVGPQGTGSTVRKIASITDMSYLEIDGCNSVGTTGAKGIVKISIAYMDGIIISNNSTDLHLSTPVSTNLGYVITSTTSGNNGKVNIDLYLQERDGENYYNILVSKLVGSAISFESPSAAAITAPSGFIAIS